MNNFKQIIGGVCAAKGFLAAGIHCGVRKNKDKKDLALIYSKAPCAAASVYTQNKVKGAPIAVTKKNIENGIAHAIICNSGNANTCNADGEEKAMAMCVAVAKELNISDTDIIIASTGVIGQPLPIEPILQGIPTLVNALCESSDNAADAIITTDTHNKQAAIEFEIGGKCCKIGGMAKGSGMIHPNMATMLCFITTDVAIDAGLLHEALFDAVNDSFNMVSIDGDTSTNDMVSILANSMSGNEKIIYKKSDYDVFSNALLALCVQLAKMVAEDGEGATKLLECVVENAPSEKAARAVSKSVITSSLFKAAMFGNDANWGRILCAVGYAKADFNIDKVSVSLSSEFGRVDVCENGAGKQFSEETALAVLKAKEILIKINLGEGAFSATAWGCDLTYDYVKINGDYRT